MGLLTFDQWAAAVDGRYVDIDDAHGGQCWDTFADLCISVFGIAPVNTWGGNWSGWAYAIWDQYDTNGAAEHFERIGPEQPARAGDVAIWTDQHWAYPASHIAPVLADAGADLLCMSQNSSPARPWQAGYHPSATGPNIRQYLTKQGLAGYLRRRSVAPAESIAPPIPKEWDDMATQQELEAALRNVLTEPPVLDRIALAVLHRDCYLVDPSGTSAEVTGTTTLAKKINWAAHNDAQILSAVVDVSRQLEVAHPVIPDEGAAAGATPDPAVTA